MKPHLKSLLFLVAVAGAAVASAQFPAQYNGSGNSGDMPTCMTLDKDGNILVCGGSKSPTNGEDYETIKYDTAGVALWKKRFDGVGHSGDHPTAITTDALGNIYVTGISVGLAGNEDFVTVKYDPAGAQLWFRRLDGPFGGNDGAASIAVNTKNDVCVTGYAATAGFGRDIMTAKYDTAGNLQWVRTYTGDGTNQDEGVRVVADNGGSWYVLGNAVYDTTSTDYVLMRYDGNGRRMWLRRYDGPAHIEDEAVDLALDLDQNLVLTGTSYNTAFDQDFATLKYDRNGLRLWLARQNSKGANDIARDLTIDGKNNVIVTGTSGFDVELMDYQTVKYDVDGVRQWVRRYTAHTISGGSYDVPCGVDVDDAGDVYVTGFTQGDPAGIDMDFDYTTVKYTSDGLFIWVQNYGAAPAHSDDFATAIVVNRSTRTCYVTGYTPTLTNGSDFYTIKY